MISEQPNLVVAVAVDYLNHPTTAEVAAIPTGKEQIEDGGVVDQLHYFEIDETMQHLITHSIDHDDGVVVEKGEEVVVVDCWQWNDN